MDIKNFNNLDLQNLSIKNFKADPLTTALRLAKTLGLADDGSTVWDTTEKKLYVWNGTDWQNADKDEEIVVVANDPTLVVPTNLTANSKIIYSSLNGFMYRVVNPTGTPVITKIGDNVVNLGVATTFNPLKLDTIQFNSVGQIWLVEDDGTGFLLSDGVDEIYLEWTDFVLLPGDNTFNITLPVGGGAGSPTLSDYRAGQIVPSKALLKNSVTVDVADEEAEISKKAVNQTTFIVNNGTLANVTGTITVQTVGK